MAKYKLASTQEHEKCLFYSVSEKQGDPGCIGYLRGDFGRGGNEFYSTWFDKQSELKSTQFKDELDNVINFLRSDFEYPVMKSRRDMASHFYYNPNDRIIGAWHKDVFGFKIQTEQHSYYVRCFPQQGDYNFYVFCYSNDRLMPFLESLKPALPEYCYSTLRATGELIIIKRGEQDYRPCELSMQNAEDNRNFADDMNTKIGVTKVQEAAMQAGSMFGWNTPAANPRNYDENGKAIKPKKNEQER